MHYHQWRFHCRPTTTCRHVPGFVPGVPPAVPRTPAPRAQVPRGVGPLQQPSVEIVKVLGVKVTPALVEVADLEASVFRPARLEAAEELLVVELLVDAAAPDQLALVLGREHVHAWGRTRTCH